MRRHHGETGGVAVEFALLLPILALFMFGLLEFGLALFNLQVVTNASREAARAGIVAAAPKMSVADIEAVARDYLSNAAYDPTVATVTVTGAQTAFPNPLVVQVSYPYNFAVLPGLIGGFVGSVNLTATTTMRQE
jgi:Flp pilus assembly protein TadG